LLAIGVSFLFAVTRQSSHLQRLRRFGQKTSAVVVDYEYKEDSDGDVTPYPLVQFEGPGGDLITARTDFGFHAGEIGQRVTVLFDPSRPDEKAHIESRSSDQNYKLFWLIGWVLIGGAATAIVVALLLYRFV
jgi:hypothetical protein